MREAYLTGTEAVFTRTGPLSKAEQALLEQGQEPAVRARYTHFDCRVHGVYRIDNELGLDAPTCPRRRKDCQVREVFDPAAYLEYYGMSNPKYHPDPEPEPEPAPAQQSLGQVPELPPQELRRRMERILGVELTISDEDLMHGLQYGLSCIDYNREQRPETDEEPAPPAEPVLTDIEHYASLMFTASEVCTVLGLDYQQQQQLPEFQEQMQRGRLMQEAQQRNTIFLHAKNGSAPAQEMADKFIRRAAIARAGSNDES